MCIFCQRKQPVRQALAVLGAVCLGLLLQSGCNNATDETMPDEVPQSGSTVMDENAAEIEAAMARLSPEDRALAEAQKVCVVSDEPLGAMGMPIKLEHDGQVVFLCCEGCKAPFEKDPAKYLAKLPSDVAGDAAPGADL